MFFSAVRHSSADVGYSWAFIFHDAKAEILSEKYTVGKSRLHGLAQMSINRHLPIDPEKVVDELAKKKQRLNLIHIHDGFSLCMHAYDHNLMN